MQVRIEPYNASDCEAVVDLSLRAWEPVFDALRVEMPAGLFEHYYPQDWRIAQGASVREALANDDMHTWVAVLDNAIVGFATLRLLPEDRMGEIYMIATDPAAQRRGVAALLIAFAEDWMKQQGAVYSVIKTGNDSGHAPARAAYERAGYDLLLAARYFKKL